MADENKTTDQDSEEKKEEATQPAEAPPSKKKGLLKAFSFLSFIPRFYQQHKLLSLIIAGVLVLIIVGGIAAYYIFSKKRPEELESATVEYGSAYFPMPDLKIAIRKENDTIGYLVIGITLKISAEIKIEEFRKREPEILDILHTYLTSVTFNNLDKSNEHCLTSSAGLERLRENIIRRINIALPPLKVDTVLFRKLICQ